MTTHSQSVCTVPLFCQSPPHLSAGRKTILRIKWFLFCCPLNTVPYLCFWVVACFWTHRHDIKHNVNLLKLINKWVFSTGSEVHNIETSKFRVFSLLLNMYSLSSIFMLDERSSQPSSLQSILLLNWSPDECDSWFLKVFYVVMAYPIVLF